MTQSAHTEPLKSAHFEQLVQFFSPQMAQVDALIQEKLYSDVSLVTQVATHIVGGGGKRLRSLIAIACAQLGHLTGPASISLAVCVEFLHTATLLHDDVVDHSHMRRGQKSANSVWGNGCSVLVGDFLYARAFELMVDLNSLAAMNVFARTTRMMAEGEVLQLMHANNIDCPQEVCFKIIQAKTAELFAASAQVGGILAGLSDATVASLGDYGRNLGFAFQLIDDLLDYRSSFELLGKNPGDDFLEGKVTFPVILAYERANEQDRVFWKRALNPSTQKPEDFSHACTLMDRHSVLRAVEMKGQEMASAARKALDQFPPSPARDLLLELTYYCITRSH